MNLDQEQLRKAIVSLSIEKVLLAIGYPVYEKIKDSYQKIIIATYLNAMNILNT